MYILGLVCLIFGLSSQAVSIANVSVGRHKREKELIQSLEILTNRFDELELHFFEERAVTKKLQIEVKRLKNARKTATVQAKAPELPEDMYRYADIATSNLKSGIETLKSGLRYEKARTSKVEKVCKAHLNKLASRLDDFGRRLHAVNETLINVVTRTKRIPEDVADLNNKVDDFVGPIKQLRNEIDDINGTMAKFNKGLTSLNTTMRGIQANYKKGLIDSCLGSRDCWLKYDFLYDNSWTGCSGERYVRKTPFDVGRYIGAILCSADRYKLVMADNLEDKFLNFGDIIGKGWKVCELIGGNITNTRTLIDTAFNSPTNPGFYSAFNGDKLYIKRGKIGHSPGWTGTFYPTWYECGITIPGVSRVVTKSPPSSTDVTTVR